MSRDIRSFFTVISKKDGKQPPQAKKSVKPAIQSDNEDIIPETPPKKEKVNASKKRKVQVLSSDSEDEKHASKPSKEKKKKGESPKKKLKPVNSLEDAFGKAPVKQATVEVAKPKSEETKMGTEIGVHDDPAFEKTLLDLDDDLLEKNADFLDRTIEEALAKNGGTSKMNDSVAEKTPNRKRKHSENEESFDTDQDRYEKRRHSAALYQKYLQRGGPKHPGSKEVPKGKADCLKDLTFMRTGVLDSLDSGEFEAAVKEHGGRVVHAVSKKVNYVVVGDEPGPAKLAKAEKYGIPNISEDEFLDLIRIKSGMAPVHSKEGSSNGDVRTIETKTHSDVKHVEEPKKKSPKRSDVHLKAPLEKKVESKAVPSSSKETLMPARKTSPSHKKDTEHPKIVHGKDLPQIERKPVQVSKDSIAWTEKYKPKDLKGIIGQQGEKSNMNKLLQWLKNWDKYHGGKNKTKVARPSPWSKNDDGAYFKCALLSGPPGVGKTTTATLVAQELGYDTVEFNASDTRSKKLLREEVSQLLGTTSLAGFATRGAGVSKKRVLLMDEVDGMAGNEDRGGIQELIALIKDTHVPVICMCNDRNHQKIRSLANYCYDLRFTKPKLEQIRGAMMTVCFKEGLQPSPDVVSQIISGAGMDVRQTLNNLAMWATGNQPLLPEEAEKKANNAKKDLVLGPWEVVKQVFSAEDHKHMSVPDKARLFFFDYSLGPLFVQENYLHVVPHAPRKEFVLRAGAAADAISMSDVIDAKIRGKNNWALLETQAFFASVMPGHHMEGHVGGQINFPSWLGKNSRRAKFQRLLNEVQSHARMSISGGRLAMCLDYLPYLRDGIVGPLIKEGSAGVEKSLDVMRAYHLLREDLDGIVELTHWPWQKDIMSQVESKVKSAFTRMYNKSGPVLPFAAHAVSKKKASAQEDLYGEEDEYTEANVDGEEDDDDVEKDVMIKTKKKPPAKASKKDEEGKVPKKTSAARGKSKKAK